MAPLINKVRMSVSPAFDTRPSHSLPPEVYWPGTRPSQGAKSRPLLKLSIGGGKPLIANAVCDPTRALSAVAALYRSPLTGLRRLVRLLVRAVFSAVDRE